MEFTVEKERIYLNDEQNQCVAEINWREEGQVMFANHTFTAPVLRGQKVAAKLLDALVAYAVEHGYKIYPVCSYVVHQFDKDDTYHDLDARKDERYRDLEVPAEEAPACKL